MTARQHGRFGRVYASDGTGAAIPIGSLSRWSVDASKDVVDTTCFEDGNKTSVLGFPGASGQLAGFVDDDEVTFFAAAAYSGAVKLYLYESLVGSGHYQYGNAYVDYSMDIAVNNARPLTGKWTASGPWTRV